MSAGKKYIFLITLFIILSCICFAACGNAPEDSAAAGETSSAAQSPEPTPQPSPQPAAEQSQPEAQGSAEEAEAVKAPDFHVTDLQGNEHRLSDFCGKPVVLNFWATWCDPCKFEMPYFQKMYDEYGAAVEFMMVNFTDGVEDTPETVAEFLTEMGYTFPVYCDLGLYAASIYGAYSLPITFFINSEGEALYYYPGAMSEEVLAGAIETMLQGETNENQT